MLERIALFGFESSGKTTLAEALASYYDEPVAYEYVREFWDRRRGYISAADLPMIARGQIAAEEQAAREARRLLFCDTELLTNRLWFDLLFPGQCPPWVASCAEMRSRRYALYLFCTAEQPSTPDPQRCFPDPGPRQHYSAVWREALRVRGLPTVELSGNLAQRLANAISAIDGYCTGS